MTHPADLDVLANWGPELADTFVMLSCDIALVLDAEGRISSLAQNPNRPIANTSWVGCTWAQTASADSRTKVDRMLADVAATGQSARREINHPSASGGSVPVAYSAARLGLHGPTLAVGQDLRAQAAMQQKFIAVQEALEQSYWATHQQRTHDKPAASAKLTPAERQSLGLSPEKAMDSPDVMAYALVDALGRLVDRIGNEELPVLLQDARQLAEHYFLTRTLARAGERVHERTGPQTEQAQPAVVASEVVRRRVSRGKPRKGAR